MIDTFHILDSNLYNQTFYYNGVTNWQVWQKPPNCSFVNIFLLGGGAGGEGGQTGPGGVVPGIVKAGGRGGGSSSVTYATFPAFAIPDTLYIQVGKGGLGGAPASGSGIDGEAGTLSYVAVLPDSNYTPQNILIPSGNAPANTLGIAGTAITLAQVILSQVSFYKSYAGQDGGSAGGSGTPGGSITPTGIPVTGGAGGGGTNATAVVSASGNINGFLFSPTISGGISSSLLGGRAGGSGYSTRENFNNLNYKLPLFFTGGAGGGSGDESSGARGGDGAFGCGGGGGGAGFTGTLGGYGGNGGNGLVIITAS
jgi:hypothetical protein